MYGSNNQLQAKHFLGHSESCSFCLNDILCMQNITVCHCLIDYDQQFAAIDQVCCRKVSFFKMAVPYRAIGPLDS